MLTFFSQRHEEKADQVTTSYRATSHSNKAPVIFNDISSNINKSNSNKSHKQLNGNINSNGSQPNAVRIKVPNGHQFGLGSSHENKSEDGNLSIPHITDLLPEPGRDLKKKVNSFILFRLSRLNIFLR